SAQLADQLLAITTTFHALEIHTAGTRRITLHHDKGGNVHVDHGVQGRHRVGADLAKLVHAGKPAKDHAVTNVDVAGDRGVVGEDAVIANDAIVGNMHIGHEKIIAADARQAVVLHGATMQGGTFANDIVVTNFQAGRFTLVFLVLAVFAH